MAYVDPYNLSLLSFAMLKELSTLKNVDLAINFSTMDLKRNADLELDPNRARFDEVAPGWREHASIKSASKRNIAGAFFRYWYKAVEGLGFSFNKEMPLVSNDQGHEIYRIAFFARKEFPMRLWRDIAKGPNRSFDFDI